jgi:arylsulfatase A-like enzyme
MRLGGKGGRSCKRYGGALVLAAATAALVGCGGSPPPNVRVDLTEPGRCVSFREPAAGPLLAQDSERPIDCYVRLPARSELIFDLAPEVPREAFDVTLLATRGPERHLPITRRGQWHVALGGPVDDPVRLRLLNRSARPLTWLRPHVVGSAEPPPPILDASARPPAGRPNVLLYVVDALRADRLGLYGHSRPTSPNLDALGTRGIVFMDAYAGGPNTLASIPTLLASRHAWELGGHLRQSRELPNRTIAESFQAAGYRTAAFQANYSLAGALGLQRGFDAYTIVRSQATGKNATAEELHAHALEWLRRESGRPFFLFVQAIDVHGYDVVPPPFAGRFSAGATPIVVPLDVPSVTRKVLERIHPERYDDAVAYTDHEIGRLIDTLDGLGLRENTILVVTADHGESLGEGGGRRYFHGHSLFEELLHVPLIFNLPWMATGLRVTETVGLARVAPTLLDLAAIAQPPEFVGRSLLADEDPTEPPAAMGARLMKTGAVDASDVEWYVREGPWKLRCDRTSLHLFHMPSDPEEANDLAAREDVRAAYLATRLARAMQHADTAARARQLENELNADQRRELEDSLRALGYIE